MLEDYIREEKDMLESLDLDKVRVLAKKIVDTSEGGKTTYIIGNGGSASSASHWACDLSKGTLKKHYDPNQKRLRVVSLVDNVPLCTALGNDLGYDEVFSQQLKNLISRDDLLMAISGSGNSKNIINAVDVAKRSGAYVFSLLGFDGGELEHMSDDSIVIPSKNYGIIEDVHLTIGHLLTESIKNGKNYVKG
jgi:D-sedoheptulose 7-phosphate isomerase